MDHPTTNERTIDKPQDFAALPYPWDTAHLVAGMVELRKDGDPVAWMAEHMAERLGIEVEGDDAM